MRRPRCLTCNREERAVKDGEEGKEGETKTVRGGGFLQHTDLQGRVLSYRACTVKGAALPRFTPTQQCIQMAVSLYHTEIGTHFLKNVLT